MFEYNLTVLTFSSYRDQRRVLSRHEVENWSY